MAFERAFGFSFGTDQTTNHHHHKPPPPQTTSRLVELWNHHPPHPPLHPSNTSTRQKTTRAHTAINNCVRSTTSGIVRSTPAASALHLHIVKPCRRETFPSTSSHLTAPLDIQPRRRHALWAAVSFACVRAPDDPPLPPLRRRLAAVSPPPPPELRRRVSSVSATSARSRARGRARSAAARGERWSASAHARGQPPSATTRRITTTLLPRLDRSPPE